jgi:hypothetical protein
MKLVLIGLVMVLAGVVPPFLMVARVMENSVVLSLASYAVSLAGVVLGLVAATRFSRPKYE